MRLVRIALGLAVIVIGCGIVVGLIANRYEHRHPGPELPECQSGPTAPGIDVSYYQESIDWPKVADAGIRFAFIRISDGLTVEDLRFERNWREAQRAGIARGSYQYFRPDQDAIAQADLVIARLRGDRGELPPAIDVETDGGLRPAALAVKVRVWVNRVREQLGVEPIIYASPDFWRDSVGGADIPQPLWLAHYTAKCPTVPQPWTRWTFWQFSQSGHVPGIAGPVDLDLGSVDALPETFAKVAQPGVDGFQRAGLRLGGQHRVADRRVDGTDRGSEAPAPGRDQLGR
jgi:GH25 family lysozyme M1 (1,4-beta-N-acetylmuramidase)